MSFLPYKSTKASLCRTVFCIFGAAGLSLSPSLADEDGSGIVDKQIAQYVTRTSEADELLKLGDESFKIGEFEKALEHYRTSLKLIPTVPATDDRRAALKDRFATAAVAIAQRKRKSGDLVAAEALLKEVTASDMLPNNQKALLELERLSDPGYTNPVLTPEHVRNVQEVSRLLQLAEGQINLGVFDKANQTCEEILRIDPYNRAARRMMEETESHKTKYYDSAYDQMRAEILNDIAKEWKVPSIDGPSLLPGTEPGEVAESANENRALNLKERLRSTTIDKFEVANERLEDVLVLLSEVIRQASPDGQSVNMFLEIGDKDGKFAQKVLSQRITVRVTEMPALELLEYICKQSGTQPRYEPFAIRILPLGSDSSALVTRTFKVPPDFLRTPAAEEESTDFFEEEDQGTSLGKRQSALDFFKQSGVTFPDDASVQYNASNNTLYARNTEGNLRLIEAIIESLKRDTPTQVVFTTTFVEINQTDLDELGYDWLLDNLALDSGDRGFLNGGAPPSDISVGSDLPPLFGSGTQNPGNSITSGLRSGASMFDADPLETRIASGVFGVDASARAPGFLAFRGAFTDADFMAVIRGLSQKTGADILLRPSIIARPGEVAKIFSGQELIYPTEYEAPQLPNNIGAIGGGAFPVTPANPAAFETRELGISLEVEATVGANSRLIDLRLAPEIADFIGFINYGSPITADATDALGNTNSLTITENRILQPIFRTRRLNTSITINDGQTIVVGGLKREARQTVQDSVPILSDIPLIGRFFKSEGVRREQRCVLIFVKARLIDPGGAAINEPQ